MKTLNQAIKDIEAAIDQSAEYQTVDCEIEHPDGAMTYILFTYERQFAEVTGTEYMGCREIICDETDACMDIISMVTYRDGVEIQTPYSKHKIEHYFSHSS